MDSEQKLQMDSEEKCRKCGKPLEGIRCAHCRAYIKAIADLRSIGYGGVAVSIVGFFFFGGEIGPYMRGGYGAPSTGAVLFSASMVIGGLAAIVYAGFKFREYGFSFWTWE